MAREQPDIRLADVTLREAIAVGIYLVKLMTAEAEDLQAAQAARGVMLDALREADLLVQLLARRGNDQ